MHFLMRSPEGQEFWVGGEYREIDPPSRIVVTDYFADEQGNMVDPTALGMNEDWPKEALIELTFEEVEGGKTRMTMQHHVGAARKEDSDGAEAGWNESFDRLAEYVKQQAA